jgi:hypothetical protein
MMKLNSFGKDRIVMPMTVTQVAAKEEEKKQALMLASAGADDNDEDSDEMSPSEDYAVKQYRLQAASVVLEWIRNGDGSFSEFEELAIGLADLDSDGEIEDGEENHFNDVLGLMADALVALGASESDVTAFVDEESDDKGEELSFSLSEKLPNSTDEDANEELVTNFMSGGELMLAAVRKVIRNGKVKLVKKRVKKRRISSAQRAGLKKARRSANKSGAKLNRKKSMRLRKSRGM